MQRALNRAYQRLQGNHPRRPKTDFSWLAHLGTDALLVSAVLAVLAGAGLIVWAFADGVQAARLTAGLALIALGPALLYLWERVAWKPFAERLSKLT